MQFIICQVALFNLGRSLCDLYNITSLRDLQVYQRAERRLRVRTGPGTENGRLENAGLEFGGQTSI